MFLSRFATLDVTHQRTNVQCFTAKCCFLTVAGGVMLFVTPAGGECVMIIAEQGNVLEDLSIVANDQFVIFTVKSSTT